MKTNNNHHHIPHYGHPHHKACVDILFRDWVDPKNNQSHKGVLMKIVGGSRKNRVIKASPTPPWALDIVTLTPTGQEVCPG